ncbi:AMP-binding, conserved site-containing protein [Artemisia annua]|uniref:AMP-binding, conserved site-containing protein n=1 Tax=Artemisia annua TaxID=35608 RepID=A0A2U1QLA9_ARTAN|nr:AMP-binding, conserved site-containing protein [Artemisia annua]
MTILNRILLNPLLIQQPPPSITTNSMSSIIGISSPSLYYRRNRLPVQLRYVNGNGSGRKCSSSRVRVYCESKTEEKQVRKYSPLLDGPVLSENNVSTAEFKTIPDIWRSTAEKFGDRLALVDPHHDPPTNMTYKQVEQDILDFSEGLRVTGIKPTEKIALFADNSCRWLIADQGIMATGAINVVRGSRSSVEELLHIYEHSESVALVVDNPELYQRIADSFKSKASVRFVILLWGEKSSISSHTMEEIPVYSYKEIIDTGHEHREILADSHDAREKYVYEPIKSDDIAALIYTSGTTGNPKGVMLTHSNLLHQVENFWDIVPADPGDRFLSMLPPWHAYERACEYFTLSLGIEQVYTTVKHLKDDLRHYQPQYMISVPLVFQTLYSGIQKQISTSSAIRKLVALSFIKISMAYMQFKNIYEGKCLSRTQKQPSYIAATLEWLYARVIAAILLPLHVLATKIVYSKIHSSIGLSKAGICGGGSLPTHVDKFYEAIGTTVQVGYGLTESSPVVAARRPDCNVLGSVGPPLRHTEIKVVRDETGEDLPPGSTGIVKVRGPQIMQGYYKNPTATKQALDDDGWLNTGDIGWISTSQSLGRSRNSGGFVVLEGRAKDTIVLSTGENVEPEQLEEAAMRSSLIQQIVVIGQDQRRLGAIIVPNKEEILASKGPSTELSKEKITGLLSEELRKWTTDCSFQIGPILVIDEPFTIDSGLMTATMKIRRNQVVELYKDQIDDLYK